jgi:HK97 family phage portal protein
VNRLLQKVVAPFVRKGEGDYHPGPWHLPVSGGWLSAEAGQYWNWWQLGYDPLYGYNRSAIVEACISAYAQTIAMLPGDHWRANKKNGRDRVTNSAASRILKFPNDYQTSSDFMLNLVRSLYAQGNAYALALRNDRYEVDELHLMNPNVSQPILAETGEIFYRLQGNDIIARRMQEDQYLVVPMRDVLHVRLNATRRYPAPLIGQSPLDSVIDDIGVGAAIAHQQTSFYMNEARPSAVISTDMKLDKEQVAQLRDRWNEQAKGLKQGGTPILTAGLKVQPWSIGGRDAAIADVAKMSKENIALAFRIPLQILGLGGTPYSSTELLMQAWIAMGLGFALNHVEEAFDMLFQLDGQPDEYIEFSTDALLRSAFKDRIDSLAKGVQGGIFSPNEARNSEGLDSVTDGEEPRVQQQVVPLSQVGKIPPAPAPPAPPAAPSQPGPKEPPAPKGNDDVRAEVKRLYAATARAARRRLSS